MTGTKVVKVSCNYTISNNPLDWIEDNKKSLLALQTGIEQQILAEINRLKRVGAILAQSRNLKIDADIDAKNGMILDYLYLQLHIMFPSVHGLPTISFCAPHMRLSAQQLAGKPAPVPTRNRIPRKYCIWIILIALLLGFGLLIILIWAVFSN
jgi:hypothetical protein